MRLTFLTTSSLDYPSPRGRWLPLARELAALGHEIHLVALHHTYDRLPLAQRCQPDGSAPGHPGGYSPGQVVVHYVGQMHVYGPLGQRRSFASHRLVQISLASAWALARTAIHLGCEAIHVCKPQPINGLAGLLAARYLRCPLYVDCDDYEAGINRFSAAWQRMVVQWWEDNLPRYAAGVTTNTRYMQSYCQARGVHPSHIVRVPNGIAPTCLVPPVPRQVAGLRAALGLADEPLAIYLGTLSQHTSHNVGLLLDAFAHVAAALPTARLLLVGDGEDRPALLWQAHQRGIAPRLLWSGPVAPAAVPAYLALAHCSVDPVADTPVARARSPLKIVESLAVGVPVVTGRVGDRAEMLAHGAAGVLVAPGSASALADGMISILAASASRQRLAHGAHEQAQRYLWPALARRWNTIYTLQ